MKKYGGFVPGIRAGKPTAGLPRLRAVADHLPGLDLPRAGRADAADRAGVGQRQPELPVRRHVAADHGRRRSGHGEADREPAAAAQLRRILALMRLVLVGAPGRGQGHPGEVHRPALQHPCRSRPATSSAPTWRPRPTLGHRGQALHGRRRPGARRGHHRHRARPAGPRRRRPTASCSTASRAPCRRPRRSTRCSPTSDRPLDVVLELQVDDDEVVRRLSGRRTCRTCGHIWHVEFDPPAKEGVCDIVRRRALPARRRQAGDDPAPARRLQRADRAAGRLLRGPRAADDDPRARARSTRSPSARSRRSSRQSGELSCRSTCFVTVTTSRSSHRTRSR